MLIAINPGSGPIEGATEEDAVASLRDFISDLRDLHEVDVLRFESLRDEGDGRWSFMLHTTDGRQIEVEMPGWPAERLRWMNEPGQNIWHFPRLYVDGSSWVWLYALRACTPDEEEETC